MLLTTWPAPIGSSLRTFCASLRPRSRLLETRRGRPPPRCLPGPRADIENKLVITRKIKLSKWQLSCARPGIVWDGPMPVTIWLSCGAKFSQIFSGVTSQDVESVCNCPFCVIIKPRKKLLWNIWFARNIPGLTGRLWRFAGRFWFATREKILILQVSFEDLKLSSKDLVQPKFKDVQYFEQY